MDSSVMDALLGQGDSLSNYQAPAYTPERTSYNLTAPEHKGLFGMKGNLRNIIGLLGDALSGRPIYQQTRQQEKASDAMINFVNDPLGSIQQMTQVDPEMALKMNHQYNTEENDREQAKLMAAYRQAQMENAKAVRQNTGMTRVSSFINALNRDPNKAESYKRSLGSLRNLVSSYDLNDLVDLPDEWNDSLSTIGYAGLTPNQQAQDEDRDTGLQYRRDNDLARQDISRDSVAARREATSIAHGDRQAGLSQQGSQYERTQGERERHNRATEENGRKFKITLPPDLKKRGGRLGRKLN